MSRISIQPVIQFLGKLDWLSLWKWWPKRYICALLRTYLILVFKLVCRFSILPSALSQDFVHHVMALQLWRGFMIVQGETLMEKGWLKEKKSNTSVSTKYGQIKSKQHSVHSAGDFGHCRRDMPISQSCVFSANSDTAKQISWPFYAPILAYRVLWQSLIWPA